MTAAASTPAPLLAAAAMAATRAAEDAGNFLEPFLDLTYYAC
jgi:hypothetical protein